MLPWYVGEYCPRQNIIDFESARELLMETDKRMVENRRFETINTMLESRSCAKNEENPESVEMFFLRFKTY